MEQDVKRAAIESVLNGEATIQEVIGNVGLQHVSTIELCKRAVSFEGIDNLTEHEINQIEKCKNYLKRGQQ